MTAEPFSVPVLFTAVGGGSFCDPDMRPPVTIRGTSHTHILNSIPPTDMLDTLDELYPAVRRYLLEQSFSYCAHAELQCLEFQRGSFQWQVVLYFTFDRPGEGVIFKMWHASEAFQ